MFDGDTITLKILDSINLKNKRAKSYAYLMLDFALLVITNKLLLNGNEFNY